jgi:glutamate N-acetyltransferase/amino-acid N-acetyltransferase
LTDAAVSPRSLQSALTYAVERSFNSISVDMSTNDAVLLLANGAVATSASTAVKEIDEESDRAAYDAFKHELMDFAIEVAQLVVRDGKTRSSLLW